MKKKLLLIIPILLSLMIPLAHATVLASLNPNSSCGAGACYQIGPNPGVNGVPGTLEFGVCVVSSSGTVTTLVLTIRKVGASPTSGTITLGAKIYSATGNPSSATCITGSSLGTSTTTVDYANTLTTTFATYSFAFSGVILSTNQVVVVTATITFSAGQPGCQTPCEIDYAPNLSADSTQSNMDDFITRSGPPNDAADRSSCSTVGGCVGYTLNGNPITSSTGGLVPTILILSVTITIISGLVPLFVFAKSEASDVQGTGSSIIIVIIIEALILLVGVSFIISIAISANKVST